MGAFPRLRAAHAAELGRAGERAAARFLRERGYEVAGTGFLARRGELDLVCRRGAELVVVEVKTRSGDGFGTPLEGVDARKRRAVRSAAAEYRALSGWRGRIRYAVVEVTVRAGGGFDVGLVEDAF